MSYEYPVYKEGYSLSSKLAVGGFRGFICKDGSVIGWPIVDGDHDAFHVLNGTRDGDFETRWRQYNAGGTIDIDSSNPDHKTLVYDWLDEAYGDFT